MTKKIVEWLKFSLLVIMAFHYIFMLVAFGKGEAIEGIASGLSAIWSQLMYLILSKVGE